MTADPRLDRLAQLVASHPGLTLDAAAAAGFAAAVGDLDAFAAAYAGHARALALCSYALRKLGRHDAALAVAAQAMAVERTFATVTAAATVHRALDDADAACPLFDEAARLDPTDTAALLEGAKLLGAAERFDESEAWFARVLERDPDHAEAQRWHIYAGYAHAEPEDEPRFAERMRRFCAQHPDDRMAAQLLRQMTGP